MEWELVVSLSPTVEGKRGLTSHTRSPTLAMNGRNLLLDPPIMGRPGVWVAQVRHNFSCQLIIKY